LYWAHEGPFIIQVDDIHLAAEHIVESMRKIAERGELRLRVTLQQKILQRCSVVATSVDAQTYPRTVGPLTVLLVDPPTSELVASIGGELLTSFLKYYNFKREVIDVASNNCVVCITILFNDMQKVNGMQLNIVRIFSEIMKHMLSIKKNVFIDL
jgi:hypothetical protein